MNEFFLTSSGSILTTELSEKYIADIHFISIMFQALVLMSGSILIIWVLWSFLRRVL